VRRYAEHSCAQCVVCPSVCPSVGNVQVPWSHRLEYFESNFTAEYLKAPAHIDSNMGDLVQRELHPNFGEIGVDHVMSTTWSSATAGKQRVSCACLPRLANWSCNAQNTAESHYVVLFLTFKRSDSRNAVRKRILSWNSHSCILQIATPAFCNHLLVDKG